MYEIGQVLFHIGSYPTIPVTRHTVDEKVRVVDADGIEYILYRISGYSVYFPEKEIVEKFSLIVYE